MNMFSLMFMLDCTTIGVYLALISNIHLYMVQIQAAENVLPTFTTAKAHAAAHFKIAVAMLGSVGLYATLKTVDTVLQVGHADDMSPLEYYINGSMVLIGIMLNMVVFHLRNEEDKDHPFYSMWHKECGNDK